MTWYIVRNSNSRITYLNYHLKWRSKFKLTHHVILRNRTITYCVLSLERTKYSERQNVNYQTNFFLSHGWRDTILFRSRTEIVKRARCELAHRSTMYAIVVKGFAIWCKTLSDCWPWYTRCHLSLWTGKI